MYLNDDHRLAADVAECLSDRPYLLLVVYSFKPSFTPKKVDLHGVWRSLPRTSGFHYV